LAYPWKIRPLPLFSSFIVFSLDLLVVAYIWGQIMNRISSHLAFKIHFRYFSMSNLAKRLPGTIWYIASRAQLYSQENIDPKVVAVGSGIDIVLGLVSSIVVSLSFAMSILVRLRINPFILIIILFTLVVLLNPRILTWIFLKFKIQAPQIHHEDIIKWVLTYLLVWICGGGFVFLVGNILIPIPLSDLPYLIGSFALLNILTTALFFSPTNLGLNELGLSLLLSNIMPSSIAVVLAIFVRLITIFYEILWAVYGYWTNHFEKLQ
jgi:hypothetical protein